MGFWWKLLAILLAIWAGLAWIGFALGARSNQILMFIELVLIPGAAFACWRRK